MAFQALHPRIDPEPSAHSGMGGHLWIAVVHLFDGDVDGFLVQALCDQHVLHGVPEGGQVVHPFHQPAVLRQGRHRKSAKMGRSRGEGIVDPVSYCPGDAVHWQ